MNTSSSIYHSVQVTAWKDRHTRQSPAQSDIYQMMY